MPQNESRRNINININSNSERPARPAHAPRRRPINAGNNPNARRVRHRSARKFEDNKKTPLMLKLLSILGLIMMCIVAGYAGTSWLMDMLNQKWLLKPENRIENQEDLARLQDSENKRAEKILNSGNSQVSYILYHVNEDNISEVRKNFLSRTQEDNMSDVFENILLLSNVPDNDKIKVLHVFLKDDTVFFDLSAQFEKSLELLGQRSSLLLLTGIVKSMTENFKPVTQVRFLIESKTPKSGGAVDLSNAWRMPESAQNKNESA